MPEIHALPEFGADDGWFYGFVYYENRLGFGEVFPGMGYAKCLPGPWWSLREWWRAARDVLLAKPRITRRVNQP